MLVPVLFGVNRFGVVPFGAYSEAVVSAPDISGSIITAIQDLGGSTISPRWDLDGSTIIPLHDLSGSTITI
jgi:hypothetical protein